MKPELRFPFSNVEVIRGSRHVVFFHVVLQKFWMRGLGAWLDGDRDAAVAASRGDLPRLRQNGRRPLARRQRKGFRALLVWRNPRCYWCGSRVEFHFSTLDHVIPISRGGSNGDENLVLSCLECNAARGDGIV